MSIPEQRKGAAESTPPARDNPLTDRDSMQARETLPVLSGPLTFEDVYDTQFSFVWRSILSRGAVRDYLQKHGNAPAGEPLADEHASSAQSPAEALDQKDAAAVVERLLSRMSDAQREVFVMYEIEEMTGAEIAEALAVNENTVRTRLRAARQIFGSGVLAQRAGQLWGGHGRSDES